MLPECQQGYLEFTDLDTISERFEKHKILRYIYRNRNRQWIEVSAIVQNRNENGRVTDIQFLTHDVTDQRERELQQEDALRFALSASWGRGFLAFLTSQDKNWEGKKARNPVPDDIENMRG